MSKIVHALQSVVVINPGIRIWSGRVTVKRHEDLVSASGLPPEALVSDGAKRIIDPKHLTALESQRRGVDRYLAKVGIRSQMGFLIKPDMEDEVHAELADRQVKFDEAKAELITNYDLLCAQWERANPGHEALLRRNRPSSIEVSAALEFDYATYRLTESESEQGRKRFESAGKSATSALIADVTQSAANLLRDSFKGRDKVTQRAVHVVRDLVGKLRDFSMFDPRVGPAAEALDKVLEGVPKKGPLGPVDTMIVASLLRSMTDPDDLLRAGQLHLGADGDDEEDSESVTNDHEPAGAEDHDDETVANIRVPAPEANESRIAAVF